jgi:hypothetical protein
MTFQSALDEKEPEQGKTVKRRKSAFHGKFVATKAKSFKFNGLNGANYYQLVKSYKFG